MFSAEDSSVSNNHGGSLYNGEKYVLYWADASSEIAFVVPSHLSGESSSVSSESLQTHGPGKYLYYTISFMLSFLPDKNSRLCSKSLPFIEVM